MRLPHVQPFAHTPLYFFTACVAGRRPILGSKVAHDVLTEIWTKAAEHDGWFVGHYLLMPDHVHFFAMPNLQAVPRGQWHKMWKSVSARSLMQECNLGAPVWQSDTFDHLLRNAESYSEKWEYVRQNPVRAGLCARPDDWPWQGMIHPLKF